MYKRYVIIMVSNSEDKVFFGRRNDSNLYTTPAGGIEKNECPFHGAAREFLEETGIYIGSLKLVGVTFTKDKNLLYLFEGSLPEELTISTTPDPDKEVSLWEWKDPYDIKDELHVDIKDNVVIQHWINN